ncbi:unnamed protein product [Dimorphilus gyrociliatus]|uniref:Uncharacterized protein n=1 Tax=Dimorphilus gyrociliatus TaxID=2664684 RepID=A0A7I8V5F0_9ANNE|nr:unnamed protein product [Dimorphilus gyrociliatus]
MPRITKIISDALKICIILITIALIYVILSSNTENRVRESPYETVKNRKPPKEDRNGNQIAIDDTYRISYSLYGYTFRQYGISFKSWASVTTGLVHSFSPNLEKEASKRFLDPAGGNVYYANSPAITWHKNQLVLVSRIWLNREVYEMNKQWPANSFSDNVLFTQKFNNRLEPISNGSILGVQTPKNGWIGDGPIEPRIFKFKETLYVSFNTAAFFAKDELVDFTFLFDYEKSLPIIPRIHGDTPMKSVTPKGEVPRDKHWMPFTKKGQLYFVHCLDPLRVMKCRVPSGFCEFIFKQDKKNSFAFHRHTSPLRGGTPLEVYEYPYYVGVVHSTLYKKQNHKRFYSSHVLVFDVEKYRIVYISHRIQVNKQVMDRVKMVRPYMEDSFIFPVSLVLESKNSWIIGAHINDHDSILLRMKGMSSLIDLAIKLDKRVSPKGRPNQGFFHQHIKETVRNETNIEFE